MYVLVETKKGKFEDILRKIRKRKLIINSANQQFNEIYVNLQVTSERSQAFKTKKIFFNACMV